MTLAPIYRFILFSHLANAKIDRQFRATLVMIHTQLAVNRLSASGALLHEVREKNRYINI